MLTNKAELFRRTLIGDKDLSDASLATKILVTRMRRDIASSPGKLDEKIVELAEYFERHDFAIKDIDAL